MSSTTFVLNMGEFRNFKTAINLKKGDSLKIDAKINGKPYMDNDFTCRCEKYCQDYKGYWVRDEKYPRLEPPIKKVFNKLGEYELIIDDSFIENSLYRVKLYNLKNGAFDEDFYDETCSLFIMIRN